MAIALLSIESVRAGEATSVPMDSWVYPALDRLAALGFIPSQIAGLRPWSRSECRRQVEEARENFARRTESQDSGTEELLNALQKEFSSEAPTSSSLTLDSIYVRTGLIAGPLLNDSFHFGQTWSDDFGRPFGRGLNAVTGFTGRAEWGRFFASVRGEYQHAPGSSPYSEATRQLIGRLDDTPTPAAQAESVVNRFRSIEAYAGFRLGDFEISAGKQSLFWGPGIEAPLSFSDNAEPTKNMTISTANPLVLPRFLRYLGRIRGEFVIGKLGGQSYTWRPWFNAQKLSFKLTENLEMGFTRWSIFWGVGHPITIETFVNNFTSLTSPPATSFFDPKDPGDRKGGFDFRYRIPGVRNWLTIYSDSYSEDDPSPLAAPRRAAISPGIWLKKLPGIPNLDFRVDVASTNPFSGDYGGQYNYWNAQYRSGNTNYGVLLGNAVGRDGRAVTGRTTYWISPRKKLEASYRDQKTSCDFLPGGGTQSDAALKASTRLAQGWHAAATFQYERFWLPVLGGPQRNLSGLLELTWEPHLSMALARR